MVNVQPGDVLALRSATKEPYWRDPAWWIRLGAAVRNQPDLSNHIAIAHHVDAHGTLWCIEGRPGGAGWVDATRYLKSAGLLTNVEQPKTTAQREIVCHTMVALIGTGYDWEAIVADGLNDVGVKIPGWQANWNGTVPVHVVCSSLAAYGYAKAGLKCPSGDRLVQPADWDTFILDKAWAKLVKGSGNASSNRNRR